MQLGGLGLGVEVAGSGLGVGRSTSLCCFSIQLQSHKRMALSAVPAQVFALPEVSSEYTPFRHLFQPSLCRANLASFCQAMLGDWRAAKAWPGAADVGSIRMLGYTRRILILAKKSSLAEALG